MIRGILASLGILCVPSMVAACDIALVLAVDVSGSVDPDEYTIQMGGLAHAIEDPTVTDALVQARARVMLMQWTGADRQIISVPWSAIESLQDAQAFADQVATTPRAWRSFSTAIGDAVEVALVALDAPMAADCKRKVIDVSGDGSSNEGTPPQDARVVAAIRGVTINALAIEESEAGLVDYYTRHVITGPGAFVSRAATFEEYPARIKAKLLREVVVQLAATE